MNLNIHFTTLKSLDIKCNSNKIFPKKFCLRTFNERYEEEEKTVDYKNNIVSH